MSTSRTASAKNRTAAKSEPSSKAPVQSGFEPPGALSSFQTRLGNRSFSQLLKAGVIQAKLSVGSSDDPLEKEADRAANMLDQAPGSIRASGVAGPSSSAAPTLSPSSGGDIEGKLASASHGGAPLDSGVRKYMESRLGADFSQVRVHTGAASAELNRELNSQAFAHGQHIHFGEGRYDAASSSGKRLLAHELTHVVQQSASRTSALVQRQPDDDKITYSYHVPDNVQSEKELYHLFDLYVYGADAGSTWTQDGSTGPVDLTQVRGKTVTLTVPRKAVNQKTSPDVKKAREESKKTFGQLKGAEQQNVSAEANKRYYERSGDTPGTLIKKGEEGKSQMWEQALTDVLKDKEALQRLPPEIKQLMGPESSYRPADYQHLLRIAEKIKNNFTPEDIQAYKLLTTRATDNLDLFEKSVDLFLARREELKKALNNELQKQGANQGGQSQAKAEQKEENLQDVLNKQWEGFDESALAGLSESDRYALAQQKANELTSAQLKYMAEHPGETAKDFAKSAALLNTGETFGAIGDDLKTAANGDANTFARWAAGTGAGAKLSGWLLALAGVIYVASWLTGVGELATIAAAAGYLLATTLTLSAVESQLWLKAASQAKTPGDFKTATQRSAAAQTNVIVGLATVVIAAVIHGFAKAAFPETLGKISKSLKNFRERIRLKGSIYEIKPQITSEMGTLKGELAKRLETAKQQAATEAAAIEKLSTDEFAAKLDKGEAGTVFDKSGVPAEQRINWGELLKIPEGRKAVEMYRAKLLDILKTDVPAQIDRVGQEYNSQIDSFLKEVEAAKNHDELGAAVDKVKDIFTDEYLKNLVEQERARITKQKLEEAAGKAHQDALKEAHDALIKRLKERAVAKAGKQFTFDELEKIVKAGEALGLNEKAIEETIDRATKSDQKPTVDDVIDRLKKRAEGEKKAAEARAEAEKKRAADELKRDWDRFDSKNDPEFKKKLADFRGSDDLTMKRSMAGGEGQIFLSDKYPNLALKRWFKSSPHPFTDSVSRLETARTVVDGNAQLSKDMSVVKIHEKGSDWILRDFDRSSVPIGDAVGDANVAAARQRAIDALKTMPGETAQELLKKLEGNSANIHWSAAAGKLVVIDTQ